MRAFLATRNHPRASRSSPGNILRDGVVPTVPLGWRIGRVIVGDALEVPKHVEEPRPVAGVRAAAAALVERRGLHAAIGSEDVPIALASHRVRRLFRVADWIAGKRI